MSYSRSLAPFYVGYAYEALARAEFVAGNRHTAAEHLRHARRHAADIEDKDHQAMLLKDLDSLSV